MYIYIKMISEKLLFEKIIFDEIYKIICLRMSNMTINYLKKLLYLLAIIFA